MILRLLPTTFHPQKLVYRPPNPILAHPILGPPPPKNLINSNCSYLILISKFYANPSMKKTRTEIKNLLKQKFPWVSYWEFLRILCTVVRVWIIGAIKKQSQKIGDHKLVSMLRVSSFLLKATDDTRVSISGQHFKTGFLVWKEAKTMFSGFMGLVIHWKNIGWSLDHYIFSQPMC